MAKEIKIEKLSGENEMDLEEGRYLIYGAEEDPEFVREQEENAKELRKHVLTPEDEAKLKEIWDKHAEEREKLMLEKRRNEEENIRENKADDVEKLAKDSYVKDLFDYSFSKKEYVAPECKIDEKCAVPVDFDGICRDLMALHARKNKDYGNAAHESYKEFGLISYVIRLNDKMKRLKSLTKPGAEISVKGESIEDTLMDLAAYAIMAIESLRNE